MGVIPHANLTIRSLSLSPFDLENRIFSSFLFYPFFVSICVSNEKEYKNNFISSKIVKLKPNDD